MSKNPINLTARFLLEIVALIAIGTWVKAQFLGILSILLMIATPLFVAIIWGIFNVEGDPSRSGKAPVQVPGLIRLLIEFIIFGFVTWALFSLNQTFGLVVGLLILAHYALSFDRIIWLLQN